MPSSHIVYDKFFSCVLKVKELTVVLSSGAKTKSRLVTSTGRTGERSVELGRSSIALLNARNIMSVMYGLTPVVTTKAVVQSSLRR